MHKFFQEKDLKNTPWGYIMQYEKYLIGVYKKRK